MKNLNIKLLAFFAFAAPIAFIGQAVVSDIKEKEGVVQKDNYRNDSVRLALQLVQVRDSLSVKKEVEKFRKENESLRRRKLKDSFDHEIVINRKQNAINERDVAIAYWKKLSEKKERNEIDTIVKMVYNNDSLIKRVNILIQNLERYNQDDGIRTVDEFEKKIQSLIDRMMLQDDNKKIYAEYIKQLKRLKKEYRRGKRRYTLFAK